MDNLDPSLLEIDRSLQEALARFIATDSQSLQPGIPREEDAGHDIDNQDNNNIGIQETNPFMSQDKTATVNPTGLQGYESDADGEYDLDDENVQPNSTFTANEEIPVYQNDVQNTGVNDGASAAVPVEDGEPVVNDEEFAKWLGEHSEDLQAQVKKKEDKIQVLEKTIIGHKGAADKWERKHIEEYSLGEKGERELNEILKKREASLKQVKNRETELTKITTTLEDLQDQLAKLEANPVEVYKKTKKPRGIRRSSKRKRNDHEPSVSDPDGMEGNDSLSENPDFVKSQLKGSKESKKNASIACRRCRFLKRECDIAPDKRKCKQCEGQRKKCRFNDPLFPGYQLYKGYLSDLHEEFEDQKTELDDLKKVSFCSVWSSNPLSGITGYGPHPARLAQQNYFRMTHGIDPISAGRVMKKKRQFQIARKKEGKQQEVAKDRQQRKRKANSGDSTPSAKRQMPNGTNGISLAGLSDNANNHLHNTPYEEFSGEQAGNSNTTRSLPQTHGISINKLQYDYAEQLFYQGKPLPLNIHQLPCWPAWTLTDN